MGGRSKFPPEFRPGEEPNYVSFGITSDEGRTIFVELYFPKHWGSVLEEHRRHVDCFGMIRAARRQGQYHLT